MTVSSAGHECNNTYLPYNPLDSKCSVDVHSGSYMSLRWLTESVANQITNFSRLYNFQYKTITIVVQGPDGDGIFIHGKLESSLLEIWGYDFR